MKRGLAAVVAALMMCAVAFGCTPTTVPSGPKPEPKPERPTEQETRAVAMVENFFERFAIEGGEGDSAWLNLKEDYGSNASGFLWTNFCGVGMQYYMCKLFPDSAEEKTTFRKMLNNFAFFRQSDPSSNAAPDSVKYHSGRGSAVNTGFGDCYFDDNIWVARNLLRAYEILGDEWYLEEAIRVDNWVLSGWNDELGGLVWSEVGLRDDASEQHLERGLSANACGIIVNAMLADHAKTDERKQFYLGWAKKFYDFCKRMQNLPESYDYWNGMHTVIDNGKRKDGTINRVHYAYNSGSMIIADLLMYDRVADADKQQYLDDALGTAKAAKTTFNLLDPGASKFYYQGDPWFAAILCEAYYDLRAYDADAAKTYMKSFESNVASAYNNRDPETELLPYQATQTVKWTHNEKHCIHQSGVVEEAVLVALYSTEHDLT